MALPTYKSTVNSAQAGFATPNKMGAYTSGYFQQAATLQGQAAGHMASAVGSVTNTIVNIAEVEANELSTKRGQIKAQEDFAQIQKLEDYKAGKLDELNKFKEGFDYDYVMKQYQQNPDDEAYRSIVLKTQLMEDDIKSIDGQIQGYLQKGSAYNVTENTRANQLNEMYLDNVMIDAKGTLAELYKSFENNPDAFEAQANTLLDNLGSVPEQFRESIKYNIKQEINRIKDIATNNLINKEKEATHARRNQKVLQLSNDISQMARDLLPITEKYNTVKATLAQQVIDGNITKTQEQNVLNALDKDIEQQKVFGQYDKIVKTETTVPQKVASIKAMADEWVKKINPYMNEDEKQVIYSNLLTKASKLETEYEKENETQFTVQTQFVKDVIKRIGAGDKVDEADINMAKNWAVDANLSREFNTVLSVKDTIDDFQTMAPTMQTSYLAKLEAQIDIIGEQGGSTFAARTKLLALQDQYAKNQKAIEKDVMGYLMKQPLVVQGQEYQPTSINEFDGQIKKDEDGNPIYAGYNQAVTEELGTRFSQKRNIEGYVGKFNILSDGEANKLNRRYQAMSRADKADFLKGLTDKIGLEQSRKVFKEMWTDKADSALVAAQLFTSGNKKDITLADDIMRGQELRLNGEVTIDTNAKSKMKNSINQKLMFALNSGGVKPAQLAVMKQAIEDGYVGRAMNNEDFDSDLMDDVFEELTFGTSTYNGNTIFNPAPGKDDDDIENWFETITGEQNTFLKKEFGIPDGYKTIDEFKKDLASGTNEWFGSPKFTVESVGRGKYLIKNVATGKYILKDKKPYIIDWFVDNPTNPKGARVPWNDESIGVSMWVETIGEYLFKTAQEQYNNKE